MSVACYRFHYGRDTASGDTQVISRPPEERATVIEYAEASSLVALSHDADDWSKNKTKIFLLDRLCRELATFKSLLTVFANTADAHQQALDEASILHRDVSAGNVFIVDGGSYRQRRTFSAQTTHLRPGNTRVAGKTSKTRAAKSDICFMMAAPLTPSWQGLARVPSSHRVSAGWVIMTGFLMLEIATC
ncbi:hypothetical protein JOM56_001608 [Amanita muscaria]